MISSWRVSSTNSLHSFVGHAGIAGVRYRRQDHIGLAQDALGLSRQEFRITRTDSYCKECCHQCVLPLWAVMM